MSRFVFLVAGAVLFAFALFALFAISHSHDERITVTYGGKVVFETEEEYSDFKRAVGDDVVDIRDIMTLSSEPPVVVDFEVRVPYDYSFGYGDRSEDTSDIHLGYVVNVFIALVGASLFWLGGIKRPKSWFEE